MSESNQVLFGDTTSADGSLPLARASRWRYAGIHALISLALAMLVGALIYFVWYPQPYFDVAGASTLMLLIMGVDVAIGPLLTLIAAGATKKRHLLILDLWIIGTLQTIAFCYGLSVIAAARPAFVVAEVDRFVLVAANELDDADLAQGSRPEYRQRPWLGPLLVGAMPPQGGDGVDRMLKVLETGKDLNQQPRYYVPYEEVVQAIAKRALSLDKLRPANDSERAMVAKWAGMAGEQPKFLPFRSRVGFHTAILQPVSNRPLVVLPIDPWP